MKHNLSILLMIICTTFLPAQQVTNTINFTADISGILGIGVGGAFDPAQDSLLIMGLDWDGLGQNVIGNRTMVEDPFNTGIFTTTLTVTSGPNSLGEGDSTKWKFKAFPDFRFTNGGWETGSDRWLVYQPDGTVINLPVIVPRIFPLMAPLLNDVDVTFNVDMSDPVNFYNGEHIDPATLEFVGMRGGADWLGNWSSGGCWCSDDTLGNPPLMYVLTDMGNNIWSRTVTVPAGTNGGIYEYKYSMMYPGANTVNGGINPLDNEGGFGINHIMLLLDGPPIIRNDVFGVFLPVPVELVSFSAVVVGNSVKLNWSTATELNNHGFEIERKIISRENQGEWVTIGFIEGYGTTTEPQNYSYADVIGLIAANHFKYRLKQVDFDGSYEYSDEVTVEYSTLPDEFSLSQNYPNPFNPATSIEFQLPVKSFVSLVVYDVLGNEITTLVNEEKSAGFYEVNFNANNLVSGVYFYRLQANRFTEIKKMILLR